MATQTFTQHIDDLDGTELPEGTRTTAFALDGKEWHIDLSEANVARLTEALSPFIEKARPVLATRGSSRKGSPGAKKSDPRRLAKIREWAGSNGHTVSSRGRISATVVSAYEAATGDLS